MGNCVTLCSWLYCTTSNLFTTVDSYLTVFCTSWSLQHDLIVIITGQFWYVCRVGGGVSRRKYMSSYPSGWTLSTMNVAQTSEWDSHCLLCWPCLKVCIWFLRDICRSEWVRGRRVVRVRQEWQLLQWTASCRTVKAEKSVLAIIFVVSNCYEPRKYFVVYLMKYLQKTILPWTMPSKHYPQYHWY